ncbi:MAG: ExeM/NucH family extracellular endonuclease [Chloroflexi bacterium]|nr:ExeM/NucH family extracellular endonuclease [Chloroflexota bacterium]
MNTFQKLWRLALIASMMAGALNLGTIPATPVLADSVAQTLPFTQNWSNTGLITVNDDWSGVSGITGYLGQNITTATGVDPQTLLTESALAGDLTVLANQATVTSTAGDVGEFEITDSVIALQGSGTADAPYILIATNTTGKTNINVAYNLRDIDGAADNAIQPVALQYRVGSSGDFTNVAAGFVADATSGPSLATLVTPVSATLPAAVDNQALVQIRIITANAVGSDEWVGIDDISITGGTAAPSLSINDVSLAEGNSGTTTFTFTAALSSPAPAGGVTFDIATAAGTATADDDYQSKLLTSQTIAEGVSDYTFNVTVYGDTTFETNETFTVDISNITGATVADGQGLGTITNDDIALPVLSVNDVTVAEGNSGTTNFGFVVSLDVAAPVGGVTFDIATADGTATTVDSDYVDQNLTSQTIPAGSTSYNFDVIVNGDANIESTESFAVNVTNVTGATVGDGQGLGTITNDDAATPNISVSNVSGAESNAGTNTFTFNVSLDIPALAGGVTFDIGTSNGTATTTDNDYVANSANGVTILEGNSSTTFDVTVNGDTTFEVDETFNVTLSNVTGANISNGTGVGTIQNDDAAPANLSINDVTVAEGNSGTTTFGFVVTLDAPAPLSGVTFDIATSDDTATIANSDYVLNSVTGATIASGNTTYNFDVTVNGDWDNEANESFNVTVSNVSGAVVTDGAGVGTITNDDPAVTPIYTIQGTGDTALSGTHTTMGVVVGDYEGGVSPQIRGFYIQDQTGDANPATSDGLFIYNGSINSVSLGDLVRVTGTVSEYQGQTQISATSISVLSSGNTILPTDISLPFASAAAEEQYEGMLVRVPQTLYVTEIYQLGRFGQITMSGTGKLYQPTNIVDPGAPALAMQAANNLNKIVVDDALNTENPDPILFGRGGNPLSASNTLRGGDTIASLVGVFTYTWGGNSSSPNAYRIRPINAMGGGIPNFVATNARPSAPPVVGGSIKAVGMNLLNYFNSFTSCYPSGTVTDCRGANSALEFTRQSDKTVNAIIAMNADVIGIVEIENDGYDASSAIQDLVNKLNTVAGAGTYSFINPDTANGVLSLGTDAIKVGILYKPAKVNPVGTTAVLNSVAFVNGGDAVPRNRPSLLQAFQTADGERFLFNVNHLKSKGSACTDPDAGDGQGNCNIVRTNAVNELINWFATNPTGTGDTDILIVGDLNSYAREDPIKAFETAGYINMVNHFGGAEAYSYVFDGQWGYLDYAIGSPSLLSQTTDVEDWHINSDEPSVLDYNVEYKTAGQITSLYSTDPIRISDHDPVITGLKLDATAPTVTSSVRVGGSPTSAASVDFTVTFSEPVTGVDANDFDLSLGGSVLGASVTNVVAVTSSIYTVTVNTGSGDGTLRLNIKISPTIQDVQGNTFVGPYTSGESYTIDRTAPTVVSIVRVGSSPTNAASVDFTVTFSEPVTGGLSIDDFSLTTSSGISGAFVTSVSGGGSTTLTVTVDTGSGNGTLRLNVVDDNTIFDLAANPLGGAAIGDGNFALGEIYTIIKSATFADVPLSYWSNSFIERLYIAGITGGCSASPLNYCPATPVSRAQMAVFLVRTMHGVTFVPPTATGVFADVPVGSFGADYIEQLFADGITSGCSSGNYCPGASVTRAQMAIFLVRAKHGVAFTPPTATGIFSDVPVGSFGADFIEQLAADGITSGCGAGIYCPSTTVKRDSMAVFLVRTFNLP